MVSFLRGHVAGPSTTTARTVSGANRVPGWPMRAAAASVPAEGRRGARRRHGTDSKGITSTLPARGLRRPLAAVLAAAVGRHRAVGRPALAGADPRSPGDAVSHDGIRAEIVFTAPHDHQARGHGAVGSGTGYPQPCRQGTKSLGIASLPRPFVHSPWAKQPRIAVASAGVSGSSQTHSRRVPAVTGASNPHFPWQPTLTIIDRTRESGSDAPASQPPRPA